MRKNVHIRVLVWGGSCNLDRICIAYRIRNLFEHQEITKQEDIEMKKPIIEIKTANESVTKKLIELGILFEDENGIHAKETCRRREK